MPGYAIHLAVANEYMKKHPIEIKNKSDFLLGSISPDFTTKDKKGETHYGENSSVLYLRKYLEKNNIDTDFNKGYFLHLITDYIFYNKLLEYTSTEIYNDYDILNEYLVKKYNVEILDQIKDTIKVPVGTETKILHKELADKIIMISSDLNIETVKEEIQCCEYTEKWDKIRRLKRY